MTLVPESGATFDVVNASGSTVYSAPIGPRRGTWGRFTVYPLDFTIVEASQYTITARGRTATTSARFPVDTTKALYSQGIRNALNFYQNERDGAEFIPTPLRTAALCRHAISGRHAEVSAERRRCLPQVRRGRSFVQRRSTVLQYRRASN
jgi:hypothetical protein